MPSSDEFMKNLLSMPHAEDYIRQGFARTTKLSPEQEQIYRGEMGRKGMSREINDPTWDARAAFLEGNIPDRVKDPTKHGLSKYKGLGDDRLMLNLGHGIVDTRTMRPPSPQLYHLWSVISRIMNE